MKNQQMDRNKFLQKYNLPSDALEKSGLTWIDLDQIYQQHSDNSLHLEPTARYIADRLRQVPEVHSLNIRVKQAEHLLEKIIRKRLADPSLDITKDNFSERITDLVGIRALHLFKEDWIPIHDFITLTWELNETPIANVRKGDPEEVIQVFRDKGCVINEHKFGYRSVHYLVKSQLSKELVVAELQVRTIFEEGWSEIDHRIRYPYDQENEVFAQFLVIFNRLAGSADEMGSFIKFLKRQLETRDEQYQQDVTEHRKTISALKAQIQKLEITKQEKEELEKKLKPLSQPIDTGFWGVSLAKAISSIAAQQGLASVAAQQGLASVAAQTALSRAIAMSPTHGRVTVPDLTQKESAAVPKETLRAPIRSSGITSQPPKKGKRRQKTKEPADQKK